MSNVAALLENSTDLFLEYGVWGLIALSFIESIFFPIPPDVVLIPLALLNPGLALWYSLLATIASVAGGFFGYLIGQKAGRPVLERYVSKERLSSIDSLMAKYGGWAVVIAGLTPIPYKVFTIASGVSRIKKTTFIFASIIGRGARFFLEGLLIFMFGEIAGELLANHLEAATVALALVCIILYLVFKYISKHRANSGRTKG